MRGGQQHALMDVGCTPTKQGSIRGGGGEGGSLATLLHMREVRRGAFWGPPQHLGAFAWGENLVSRHRRGVEGGGGATEYQEDGGVAV